MSKRKNNLSILLAIASILAICLLLIVLVGYVIVRAAIPTEVYSSENKDYTDIMNSEYRYNMVDLLSYTDISYNTDDVEYYDFSNASTTYTEEEESSEPIEYEVQYGDSFWSIADKFYGDGLRYTYIMASNNMTSLHPGDIVTIYDPEVYEVDESTVEEMTTIATQSTVSYTEPSPVGYSNGTKPDWTTYKDTTSYDTTGMTYAGNFRITGYDPHCVHCCGKSDGITASGNQAILGYSVGCNSLPLGTIVYIVGYGIFRVDDVGGSSTNLIDIACDSHDICFQMTGKADVYIIR